MKLGNGLGASGAYFLKVFLEGWLGAASCSSEPVLRSEQVGAFWWGRASWRDGAMLIINNLYRGALLGTQVAILYVCNKQRICSVWQVAWERMNVCSYVTERMMQSSSLLREGGLRNDAARAALWRTRPYECAIDVCQLLTMVIADVCRELSFHLYWFATNGGFARFDNVVNRMETFERETTYE